MNIYRKKDIQLAKACSYWLLKWHKISKYLMDNSTTEWPNSSSYLWWAATEIVEYFLTPRDWTFVFVGRNINWVVLRQLDSAWRAASHKRIWRQGRNISLMQKSDKMHIQLTSKHKKRENGMKHHNTSTGFFFYIPGPEQFRNSVWELWQVFRIISF